MVFKIISALPIFLGFLVQLYGANDAMVIKLKPAHFKEEGLKSLLEKRHSCRDFEEKTLNLDDIASVLWATCGRKYDAQTAATRTIPSAGATYPLELYLVVGKNAVDKLKEGIYHYSHPEHQLQPLVEGDKRDALAKASLGQDVIREAPVSLVIAAVVYRTTRRYGNRGERYVYMEAGHAAQNAYLATTCLGLGTVEVGAFRDDEVKGVLGLEKDCEPLIIMPIGYARKVNHRIYF